MVVKGAALPASSVLYQALIKPITTEISFQRAP